MDDPKENLNNYRLQLQQVEAALTTDPTNEELLKLKSDLEEVIVLTIDLLKAQILEKKPGVGSDEEISEVTLEELTKQVQTKKDWKIGDKCLAQWSEDGQYYEAVIEDITEDGEEVSVVFDSYQTPDVTTLSLLREIKGPVKKFPGASDSKSRKQASSKLREYQKKRKQKKLQRYKQMEEEREGEKNKWLAFKLTNKVARKAMAKKSIFASPDNVNGRVGIGTCGISGKPMTEFVAAEKWRKGM